MGKTPDMIKLIQLPELTQLEPISRTEAKRRGLIPDNFLGRDLGLPGN